MTMAEINLGIKGIGWHLPAALRSSQELAERFGFDLEFLESKVGVKNRHLSGPDESVSDMAAAAARHLFQQHPDLNPGELDLLVVCTQTPDYQIPHTAALVQAALELPSLAAFDINLACSGYVYGLSVCQGLMAAQGWRNGLLITSEAYSKILRDGDRDTLALFGDGATATWLGPDPLAKPLRFTFGTDGRGFDKLIVREGGSRNPWSTLGSGPEPPAPQAWGKLFMDGRGIFDFAMRKVPEDVKRCLQLNDLTLEEVDFLVFHQASRYILEWLGKRLQAPPEKMFYAMQNTGNTVSSSIPLALAQLRTAQDLTGKKVLICGFGGGLSWACTVLQF